MPDRDSSWWDEKPLTAWEVVDLRLRELEQWYAELKPHTDTMLQLFKDAERGKEARERMNDRRQVLVQYAQIGAPIVAILVVLFHVAGLY